MMTVPPSDVALWEAAREGDAEAFGLIVRRYQGLLCGLAYSRTGDFAAAQDLAQETFVRAWRQRQTLREPERLRAWLGGILRHLAASEARTRQRRGSVPESVDQIAEPVSPADDPETQAISQEEQRLLWRVLAEVPEQFREPLILFYRHEQSVAEVARQLELSEQVVKQRLSRGRARMRGQLGELLESAMRRSAPRTSFAASVMSAIAFAGAGAMPAGAMPAAGMPAGAVPAGGMSTGGITGSALAAAGSKVLSSASSAGLGPVIAGPATGLFTAWLASRAVGATAQCEAERLAIAAGFRRGIGFTLAAILGLILLLAAGRSWQPDSPWWIIAVAWTWTGGLLAYLLRLGQRLQREIAQFRAGQPEALRPQEAQGWTAQTRLLGLPLYAIRVGGLDVNTTPSEAVRAWIAVGDLAISPLLAIGGMAIAPVAIGGVTIGLLSLSLAGIAAGGLAVGSLAVGWWAVGAAAIGWRAAVGAAAVARDYALGAVVEAAEANTPLAHAWFAGQWFWAPVQIFLAALPWVIALTIVLALAWLFQQGHQRRRSRKAQPTSRG